MADFALVRDIVYHVIRIADDVTDLYPLNRAAVDKVRLRAPGQGEVGSADANLSGVDERDTLSLGGDETGRGNPYAADHEVVCVISGTVQDDAVFRVVISGAGRVGGVHETQGNAALNSERLDFVIVHGDEFIIIVNACSDDGAGRGISGEENNVNGALVLFPNRRDGRVAADGNRRAGGVLRIIHAPRLERHALRRRESALRERVEVHGVRLLQRDRIRRVVQRDGIAVFRGGLRSRVGRFKEGAHIVERRRGNFAGIEQTETRVALLNEIAVVLIRRHKTRRAVVSRHAAQGSRGLERARDGYVRVSVRTDVGYARRGEPTIGYAYAVGDCHINWIVQRPRTV